MESEVQPLQLADYMDIFSGDIHNYGVHTYAYTNSGKEEGKNTTITSKLLTIEQYKAHLNGKVGLGIIPIDAKGEVKFGVIDIDVYDANLNHYIEAIERNDFPLIPFRSKSGGLHIYMFVKHAVSAKAMLDILNTMIVLLGLDLFIKTKLNRIIEIFPKQTKIAVGGVGSWINMPYYNSTDTKQYAIRNNKALTFDDALAYIKEKRCALADIRLFINDLAYKDGPPCLQTINLLHIMSKGTGRNNYLFSFGVYLKKMDPEFWEQKLFDVNSQIIDPLPKTELEATIISSLRKKDYAYKCSEQPCVDFCRKAMCKAREYGVGKEGGYFSELEYGKLVQVKAYEPYYEWECKLLGEAEFKVLRFKNEADIIGQDAFLRLCFRELKRLPIKLKQSEWYKLVNQALSEMELVVVDKEDDTTPIGLFKTMFIEFLTDRAMAQTREQILNKRVYYDPKVGKYYFRTSDLGDYIFIMKGFRYFAPGELHGLLRDFKAEPARLRTERGNQLRVYEISEANVKAIGYTPTEVFEAKFAKEKEQF